MRARRRPVRRDLMGSSRHVSLTPPPRCPSRPLLLCALAVLAAPLSFLICTSRVAAAQRLCRCQRRRREDRLVKPSVQPSSSLPVSLLGTGTGTRSRVTGGMVAAKALLGRRLACNQTCRRVSQFMLFSSLSWHCNRLYPLVAILSGMEIST